MGVAAILLTLPIAYHWILAYGVQTHIDRRVAVHSLAGCFLYGAIAASWVSDDLKTLAAEAGGLS